MYFESSRDSMLGARTSSSATSAGSADILSASSTCRLEACAPGADVRAPSKMRLPNSETASLLLD